MYRKRGRKRKKKEFISLNYPLDDFVLGGDATKIAKNLHLYNGKGITKKKSSFCVFTTSVSALVFLFTFARQNRQDSLQSKRRRKAKAGKRPPSCKINEKTHSRSSTTSWKTQKLWLDQFRQRAFGFPWWTRGSCNGPRTSWRS